MKTVIIYGSMAGATEGVAQDLGSALENATVLAAGEATADALEGCGLLVLGASTWGMGDLQDDMADFLGTFSGWDVAVACGAVFGLGDQFGYGDTFVDGIADMADALEAKGIKRIGSTSSEGYEFGDSRAQADGKFAGLALDQDNEPEKTHDRLVAWVKQLREEAGA